MMQGFTVCVIEAMIEQIPPLYVTSDRHTFRDRLHLKVKCILRLNTFKKPECGTSVRVLTHPKESCHEMLGCFSKLDHYV